MTTSTAVTDSLALLDDLDFVRRLAWRLCRDRDDAEDLAQEVLTRSLERPPADDLRRRWLVTVTKRLAINGWRSKERQRRRETEVAALRETGVPSTAEVAEREELRRQVVHTVQELDEAYRVVILLRYERGLDTKTTAELLGVAEATVRSRLKRALDQIRGRLDARQQEGGRRAWIAVLGPWAGSGLQPGGAVASAGSRIGQTATGGKRAFTKASLGGDLGTRLAVGVAALLLAGLGLQLSFGGAASPAPASAVAASGASQRSAAHTDATPVASDSSDTARERTEVTAEAERAGPGPEPRLAGSVYDRATGRPLAGVPVRLFAQPADGNFGGTPPVEVVQTGSDGSFEMPLARLLNMSNLAQASTELLVQVAPPHHSADSWSTDSLRNCLAKLDEHGVLQLEGFGLHSTDCQTGVVVDPAGRPVVDAKVVTFIAGGDRLGDTSTVEGGVFELDPIAPEDLEGSVHVMAWHPTIGLSRPQPWSGVASATSFDLVLDRTLGVIEGRLVFPDGSPATGKEIALVPIDDGHGHDSFESDEDEEAEVPASYLDGVELSAELSFGLRDEWGLMSRPETETDDDGRYAFRAVVPGRFAIQLDDGEFATGGESAEVGEMLPSAKIVCEHEVLGAQLAVRITDSEDHPLPMAWFSVYRWDGEEAREAQRRFDRDGATGDLLATGEVHECLWHAMDRLVAAVPDAFYVVEASYDESVFGYGGVAIGPEQYRGDVHIRLLPRSQLENTGAFRLSCVGDDAIERPVWVKLTTRYPKYGAIPIAIPGHGATYAPRSRIVGPWYRLEHGDRIPNLPAGDYIVETLARIELSPGGRLVELPCPLESHSLQIVAGRTTELEVSARAGQPLRFDFRPPPLAAGQSMEISVEAILLPDESDRVHLRHLLPGQSPTSTRTALRGGEHLMGTMRSFAVGSSQMVRLRIRRQLVTEPTAAEVQAHRARSPGRRLIPRTRELAVQVVELEVDIAVGRAPVRIDVRRD